MARLLITLPVGIENRLIVHENVNCGKHIMTNQKTDTAKEITVDSYFAGFDVTKFFGCIMVALSHIRLNQWIASSFKFNPVVFMDELIPLFFMMAGFLFGKSIEKKDKLRHTKRYVIKYTVLYYSAAILTLFQHYFNILLNSGEFIYKDMVYVLLTMPFHEWGIIYHLWFIPPLIAGVTICGFAEYKNKMRLVLRVVIAISFAVIAFSIGSDYFSAIIPCLYISRYSAHVWWALTRYVKGVLFVCLGAEIYRKKDLFLKFPIQKTLLPICIFTIAEMWMYYRMDEHVLQSGVISFSSILWSVFFFWFILRYKNDRLKQWHKEMNVFSGLMYFLHVLQINLFRMITMNWLAIFSLVMCINAALTWYLCRQKRSEA